MQKRILVIILICLLVSCKNENRPDQICYNELVVDATIISDKATKYKWPDEWNEVIECGNHRCIINAHVEATEGPWYKYLVYSSPFSFEYQQRIKNTFLQSGRDPRNDANETNALFEIKQDNTILLEWCGPNPVQQLESWIIDDGGYPGEEGHSLDSVSISVDDAKMKADSFIASIGLTGQIVVKVEKARIIDGPSHQTFCEGWMITYMPDIPEYVPIYYFDKSQYGPLSLPITENEPPFPLLGINVFVTEDGIVGFDYINPVTIQQWEQVSCKLMDFERVKEYISKYFKQGCINMKTKKRNADPIVLQIILSYAFSRDQKAAELNASGVLSPVWVALFTTEYESMLPSNPISFVCIDAITGELVTPDNPKYESLVKTNKGE